MSLDVYLRGKAKINPSRSAIFIREGGQTREISREEWDLRHPDREPVTLKLNEETDIVYHANITHNLGAMAKAASLYHALWRPDEMGITKARQLIPLLQAGLNLLVSDPEEYQALNPKNGWGDYEGLVKFVQDYLNACVQNPNTLVEVSR
jgi:hypothetical protein